MGAPRIRPAAGALCVDGPWIAAQLGRPVHVVYRQARDGVLPPPVADAIGRGESARNWRWSRAQILAALGGAA